MGTQRRQKNLLHTIFRTNRWGAGGAIKTERLAERNGQKRRTYCTLRNCPLVTGVSGFQASSSSKTLLPFYTTALTVKTGLGRNWHPSSRSNHNERVFEFHAARRRGDLRAAGVKGDYHESLQAVSAPQRSGLINFLTQARLSDIDVPKFWAFDSFKGLPAIDPGVAVHDQWKKG